MTAASFDWANLGIAGAFVVGMLAGAVLMVRLLKIAMEVMRTNKRETGDVKDGPDPE